MVIFICDGRLKGCASEGPSSSVPPCKIRTRNRVSVQRSCGTLKLSPSSAFGQFTLCSRLQSIAVLQCPVSLLEPEFVVHAANEAARATGYYKENRRAHRMSLQARGRARDFKQEFFQKNQLTFQDFWACIDSTPEPSLFLSPLWLVPLLHHFDFIVLALISLWIFWEWTYSSLEKECKATIL